MSAARSSTVVGIFTLAIVVGMILAAIPAQASTTKDCYPVSADADGDGYAASGTSSVEVSISSSALKCPSGYVSAAGDCNDANAAVHPYHEEIAFNAVDDNCSGLADEAKPEYSAAGNANGLTSFAMTVTVKDIAIFQGGSLGLYAEVELTPLVGSQFSTNWVRRGKTAVPALSIFRPRVTVTVSDLTPSTVYKARLRFYRLASNHYMQVGRESDWYYTTTTGYGELEAARTSILLRGFKELDESNRGRVGYRGTVNADGKRYGASGNEKWCSEFYVWVTKPYLNYESTFFGLPTNVGGVILFFQMRSAYHSSAVLPLSGRSPIARRGDYMPVNDKGHSTMLLAIDAGRSQVWTLEGNSGNRVKVNSRAIYGTDGSPNGLGHITTSTLD
jgi:hypothetical protein